MKARRAEILAAFGAWSAMLLSALFNLLNYSEYPILSPEVALVAAILLVIATGAGLVHTIAPRLSFAFTASLVAIGFGLNGASESVAIALGLGALVLAWFYDRAVLKIVTVVFATVALFQLGDGLTGGTDTKPIPNARPGRSDLPPVVHIVLDAYLGTEGMAADPALAQLREETIAFYGERGFRLYDGAYSRHAHTANSIPFALSFGDAPLAITSQKVQTVEPPKLTYFELLKNRGYTISSLHVDFIDYCTNQSIDHCATFRRSDLSATAHYKLSTSDRVKLIGLTLANMGRLPTAVHEIWRKLTTKLTGNDPAALMNRTKLFPLASVKAMEGFIGELTNARNGQVYFAHFLVPHDPYAFEANCRIRPHAEWQSQGGPGTIAIRQAAYADQVRCTMQLIDRLLKALDRTAAGRNAIVVLHGDHGSRNASRRPDMSNQRASARDYAMTYSTLFAVRAPDIEPGLSPGRAPLEQLIGDLARSDFRKAPETGRGAAQVYLENHIWIPKKLVALPVYGTASTDN